ncbi:three component ABC system middle component [Lysobacter silvisoli]|uniref:three component ABC system middle component n=1 Tax=Lysobacter silvisoli TaxID=2293254 RepID=UPI003CCDEA79
METNSPNNNEPRLTELDRIYNPAYGAYLLWSGVRGYLDEDGQSTPLPLIFLFLPLLVHAPTRDVIASTNNPSGLTLFAAKIGQHQENLLAIHHRAVALKDLTYRSFVLARNCNLLVFDNTAAHLYPVELTRPPPAPESVRRVSKQAAKLGAWLARLPVQQIASTLRIDF